MELVIGAVIVWVVPIFVANAIGKPKRRAGFLYGLFLGWIGVIILALLPPAAAMSLEKLERLRAQDMISKSRYEQELAHLTASATHRECPFCKEQMRRDASVCPHCRRESEAWTFHEGSWWVQRDVGWLQLDERTGQWRPVAD